MADVFRHSNEDSKVIDYEGATPRNQDSCIAEEDVLAHAYSVVEKTKAKISTLRTEVCFKDKELRKEKALRRAAERREQDKSREETYVDLYAGSSPSVNEDLKEHLSLSAQRKRLLGEKKSRRTTPERKGTRPKVSHSKTSDHSRVPTEVDQLDEADSALDAYLGRVEAEKQEEPIDTEDQVESLIVSDQMEDSLTQNSSPQRKHHKRKGHPRSSQYREYTPPPPQRYLIPSGTWYGDGIAYPAPPSFGMLGTWVSPHRLQQDPKSYPLQTWPGRTTENEQSQSSPNLVNVTSDSPIKNSLENLVGPIFSTPLSKGNTVPEMSPGGGLGTGGSTQTSSGIPVGVQVDGPIAGNSNTSHPHGRDLSFEAFEKGLKFADGAGGRMAMLIAELGAAKDLNKELSEKLEEAEKQLETLEIKQSLSETLLQAEIAAKGAALVDEIYSAQKQHDEAILARMKLANDDRDDAVARLRRMEAGRDDIDSGTDVYSNDEDVGSGDVTVPDLMKKLSKARTQPEIKRYGSVIVNRINDTRHRRKRITSEEMKAILEEKDAAITKAKRLEREVIDLRKTQEGSSRKSSAVDAIKMELKSTKKERDSALHKAAKLKEELDSLKMYYSLHKSLSQESNLRDQFNNSLQTMEDHVKHRDQILTEIQSQNQQLSSQLQTALDERNQAVTKLQHAEQENARLQQQCLQHERLIGVLRKKATEGSVKTVN